MVGVGVRGHLQGSMRSTSPLTTMFSSGCPALEQFGSGRAALFAHMQQGDVYAGITQLLCQAHGSFHRALRIGVPGHGAPGSAAGYNTSGRVHEEPGRSCGTNRAGR